MKTILIICCLAIAGSAIAQDPAKVYFIRKTQKALLGSGPEFKVFIDEKGVCNLSNYSYSIHEVKPGIHTFSGQFYSKEAKDKTEKTELTVEAGKTYYIELVIVQTAFKGSLSCNEITENTAKKLLKELKEDSSCL